MNSINLTEMGNWAKEVLATYGPSVIKALAILLIGRFAARLLTGIVRRILRRANIDETLTGFASHLTYALLMALVVISAIQQLGVPTASFVAVVGAAGLAVGFALQGSLANFAAGVMLIVFRPFKTGDFVEAAGVSAVVEEVQVFATRFRTGDNRRVIVPNAAITNGTITNYSANDTRRIDLVFGIGYADDIDKAKRVLQKVVDADERIRKEPACTIAVSELADSSVNLVVRPWVAAADYWSVRFDLTETVKREFDSNAISIPFPQRDVHLHQVA